MGVEANLDKFPNIAALQKKVESNERIAAWLTKRPQTNFWKALSISTFFLGGGGRCWPTSLHYLIQAVTSEKNSELGVEAK